MKRLEQRQAQRSKPGASDASFGGKVLPQVNKVPQLEEGLECPGLSVSGALSAGEDGPVG